ncbi:MAG TPA: glycosyltransferase [Candidatus Ozemobacteraceae bacterium]|nr:glycosyltransferase [Candidatus Ozemobacteraceae bacterium]
MYREKRERYHLERQEHWERVHAHVAEPSLFARAYQRRIAEVYEHRIAAGSSILEVGCGCGRLLRALRPSRGVGIDFSARAVETARRETDGESIVYHRLEASTLRDFPAEPFDFIILSDVLNDLWDVQELLAALQRFSSPHTRLLINMQSHLWKWPLKVAQAVGMAQPTLEQNWLTVQDLRNLLHLTGWEFMESWPEVLFPADVPGMAPVLNRFIGKLFPFYHFCLTNFVIARPPGLLRSNTGLPSVSVIVPARNEEGNIVDIFRRVPQMGRETELIFVEGGSTDRTREKIEEEKQHFQRLPCSLYAQAGTGKRDAVRLGFDKARGDILMILDADLTVAPEELMRFYEALVSGKGEFINGVRLVYPLEKEAMQFCNMLGNRFFSQGFSWVLGQPIKDTLCGTKVLWRRDYERLVANRPYFGDFDPFGDFDLLFGAAKLNLKILDLPIRYFERQYGTTNISRWRHGFWLLLMLISGARRLKFV